MGYPAVREFLPASGMRKWVWKAGIPDARPLIVRARTSGSAHPAYRFKLLVNASTPDLWQYGDQFGRYPHEPSRHSLDFGYGIRRLSMGRQRRAILECHHPFGSIDRSRNRASPRHHLFSAGQAQTYGVTAQSRGSSGMPIGAKLVPVTDELPLSYERRLGT
jgi:hypothetical protein